MFGQARGISLRDMVFIRDVEGPVVAMKKRRRAFRTLPALAIDSRLPKHQNSRRIDNWIHRALLVRFGGMKLALIVPKLFGFVKFSAPAAGFARFT